MTHPADAPSIHATCVVVGESGILIRGASGSGKSTLARDLVGLAASRGFFARLVADDRVALTARGGRLVARPVPPLAGLMEIRGVGLVSVPHEAACVLRLIVDLEAAPARMPDASDLVATELGVTLPRLPLRPGPDSASLVLWRFGRGYDAPVTKT